MNMLGLSRRRTPGRVIALLAMALSLPYYPCLAADSVTAIKTLASDGTPSFSGTRAFTLTTDQIIEWESIRTDLSDTAGNTFYLRQPMQPLNEIPLSVNLPEFDSGTHALNAGDYEISIEFRLMGAGRYTINYNRTASIGISSDSDAFEVFTGESTSSLPFEISSTGDLPVTIDDVSVGDTAHFEITRDPAGDVLPPDETLEVRCNGGVTPGTFRATITVSGTSDVGPVSATAAVTCEVLAREPHIVCPSPTPSLGTADWFVGEILTEDFTFNNDGAADLELTRITLENDGPEDVFSLQGEPDLSEVPSEGGERDVSIRFAPEAEGEYRGHLEIHSNDPDDPVECDFTARAHHPVPIMRLESTTLDYREVELGFTFTRAVIVHNDGDAPLNIDLANLSEGDADLVHFNLETGAATVRPGDPPAIFRQKCSPQIDGGPYEIRMQVTGNDLENPSEDIDLTCSGTLPTPIDSVLVLDRSGSMADEAGENGRHKIHAMQAAADLFIHLLRPDIAESGFGDKLGFVRYNQESDQYLPLDFVEDEATVGNHLYNAEEKLSAAAIRDIDRLLPDGTTAIGNAMQTGAAMLAGSPADRKHVMVVMTDGRENEEPWISQVIAPISDADPDLKVYSVGVGNNMLWPQLEAISNMITDGYHQVVDDLSGISNFDLEVFYFKIFANATGMELVVDPTHVVKLEGSEPVPLDRAHITSSDHSATFLVLDVPEFRSLYDLELVDPQGNVVVLGSSVGSVPVHVLQRHNYTLYRVVFPAIDQAETYTNDWVLRLTPKGDWDESSSVLSEKSVVPQELPFGFSAAVTSDYRMQVQVLPSSYLPGAQITLTVQLTDRGWPMTDGVVEVDVTTPSHTRHDNLQLHDDGTHGDVSPGDGTWTRRFIQTAESGAYRFFFHAVGENERGEMVPRQATRYAILQVRAPDPDAEPCIPCNLQWLLWAVALLLLLLLLLCSCWGPYIKRWLKKV